MIWNVPLAIGRLVDRVLGNAAPPRPWATWPPLQDDPGSQPRIDAPRAAPPLMDVALREGDTITKATKTNYGANTMREWAVDPPFVVPATGTYHVHVVDDEHARIVGPADADAGSVHLSAEAADELRNRDAVGAWWAYRPPEPVQLLEPDRLAKKWCAYHYELVDPVGGVDVVSHDGPAAGCTWCCASCLARATVIGGLRFDRDDEPVGPRVQRLINEP